MTAMQIRAYEINEGACMAFVSLMVKCRDANVIKVTGAMIALSNHCFGDCFSLPTLLLRLLFVPTVLIYLVVPEVLFNPIYTSCHTINIKVPEKRVRFEQYNHSKIRGIPQLFWIMKRVKCTLYFFGRLLTRKSLVG